MADEFDPPANYYDAATGTGATLNAQLTTIMSTGHILRSYGDFRYSAAITDADPDFAGNILLVYNRASVPATWDAGTTWNREHVWPDSLQPQNASNGATGAIADPHMLRPANPSINSSRGNKPYGLDSTTGDFGAVTGGYYYPGDADKGDLARTLFYAATRWSSLGFTLVEGTPSGIQMGDLSSLINWNYLDVPDTFERGRNQKVFSQSLNPSYYTNNRNAYVDHPEYVWSVFVDQLNDSQISIDGGAFDGSGGTSLDVDFGRVFVGSAAPAAQEFTLNKSGFDGTYYEVTTAGDATSSLSGRFNAFRNDQADSKSITVGLNVGTETAGLKSGTVTIDNLDVTTGAGTGHGANDADDSFNVSLAVLDHAQPSFDSESELTSRLYDFGSVVQGSIAPTFSFDVFNYGVLPAFTADLDFDNVVATGDSDVLTANLSELAGTLSLGGGASQEFAAMIDTTVPGEYAATYTISFSDEDLAGALTKTLTLTLVGDVVSADLPGDYNEDHVVDAADYTMWRNNLGSTLALPNDDTPGVDITDYDRWKTHFGQSSGGGGRAGERAVPEPASAIALLWAVVTCGLVVRRGRSERFAPFPIAAWERPSCWPQRVRPKEGCRKTNERAVSDLSGVLNHRSINDCLPMKIVPAVS